MRRPRYRWPLRRQDEMAQPPPMPDGSNIEEIDDFDGRIYRWRPPSGGPLRYLVAAFLIVWLCGWAAGFVAATHELWQNNGDTRGFLVLWLVGWTLGGVFAMLMLYIFLRRPHPESIALRRNSFHYDSGTSPPVALLNPWYAMRYSDPNEMFGKMFRRRKQIEIPKRSLGNVVLERIGERQRLYFDHGAQRIEIGEHLREPEREWLAEVIQAWKAT